MGEDNKTALLRATDSDLECFIAGYLLSHYKQTIRQLYDKGAEIVAMRMPQTHNAVRQYVDVRMNPAAPLARFVNASKGAFSINEDGEDLGIVARYRLTHALENRIPVKGLFSERNDPVGLCRFLLHAESEGGTKTVQALSKSSGLSVKQSSDFLHRLASYGLAERTTVKNGHGVRLAMDSNGPLTTYMRGIKHILAFIDDPEDKVAWWNLHTRSVSAELLPDRIRMYEAQTGRTWGK